MLHQMTHQLFSVVIVGMIVLGALLLLGWVVCRLIRHQRITAWMIALCMLAAALAGLLLALTLGFGAPHAIAPPHMPG